MSLSLKTDSTHSFTTVNLQPKLQIPAVIEACNPFEGNLLYYSEKGVKKQLSVCCGFVWEIILQTPEILL